MSFNFNALSKKLQDVATQTSSRVNETINSIDFKQIQETTTNTFDKTTRLFEEKTNMKNIDITQYPQEYTQAVNKFKHYEQVINKSLNFTSIVDYNDYDINYHLSQSLTNYDVNELKNSLNSFSSKIKNTTSDFINNGTLSNAHFDSNSNTKLGFNHTFSLKIMECLNLLKEYPEDEYLRLQLLNFSNIQNSLGDLKLIKNEIYKSEFNLSLKTLLLKKFNPIHDLISKVEDNRITYDIQRSKVLDYTKKNNSTTIDQDKLEEIRNKMNLDEDVFANSIENCILEINKLFEELNLLDYFKKLVQAELDYHKNSVKLLESFDF
ncbi:hypothetical protein ACO0OE_001962 [Hanseniaspora uvarum]|uniref:Protein GVP36 n=1 Tax=Hanseniaspora uvarum TaxID=29833 RepID=A0A1E5RK74_HANUV|nr:Protein GVP36 [Hanseniaspora uvarum]GMM39672.1 Gvp36 protein [Hanseniaspora uvarum]